MNTLSVEVQYAQQLWLIQGDALLCAGDSRVYTRPREHSACPYFGYAGWFGQRWSFQALQTEMGISFSCNFCQLTSCEVSLVLGCLRVTDKIYDGAKNSNAPSRVDSK